MMLVVTAPSPMSEGLYAIGVYYSQSIKKSPRPSANSPKGVDGDPGHEKDNNILA